MISAKENRNHEYVADENTNQHEVEHYEMYLNGVLEYLVSAIDEWEERVADEASATEVHRLIKSGLNELNGKVKNSIAAKDQKKCRLDTVIQVISSVRFYHNEEAVSLSAELVCKIVASLPLFWLNTGQ